MGRPAGCWAGRKDGGVAKPLMAGLRTVVVGSGFASQHVEWLHASEHARVTELVFSSNAERANAVAAKHGVPSVSRELSCITKSDVDLVVVVSPPSHHAAAVRTALEAGKLVVCDKPLATNAAEARALARLAAERGLPGMTFFQWRSFAPFRELRRLLREESWGALHYIHADFRHDFLAGKETAWPWRHRWLEASAGAFADMGVHLIDLLPWLLGKKITVERSVGRIEHSTRWHGSTPIRCETDDSATALFTFEDAATCGAMHVSRCSQRGRFIKLSAFAEKGEVELHVDVDTLLCTWRRTGSEAKVEQGKFENPYLGFLRSVRERPLDVGRETHPTLEDGADAQLVLDSVSESLRKQLMS